MKRQRMLVSHNPAAGSYGDCFRVSVACLLNLDASEVPHVFENGEDGPTGHARMEAFLRERGLHPIWICYGAEVPFEAILASIEGNNPGVPFIVGGESVPGVGHFIVCQAGRMVCDPNPLGLGLLGPHTDGIWYVMFIGAAVVLDAAA